MLEKIRTTVRTTAPKAEEHIKYGIPTFTLNGMLLSFAAYKNHIGLYPVPKGDRKLRDELSIYRSSKSTLRFPLDKPVPLALIRKIVRFRAQENLKKAEARMKKQ
jgi:uncharacterized protein YdhG (YjbR/CyaY superfamily)